MELHYQLWNQTNSPLSAPHKITFLHGLGGTGALWRPIAAGLESEMAVLAPDQRGHGKSQITGHDAASASYFPEDYGQDVVDTLRSLSFFPTWGVGHSMGARTVTAAAHLAPELFKGIILVDIGLSGLAGGGLGINLSSFLTVLPAKFATREEAKQFMLENCPDPSIGQYLMAVSTKNPDGSIEFPFDRRALLATLKAAQDYTVRDWVMELGQAGMPVLLLRGQKSGVWTEANYLKEKAAFAKIPSVQFIEVPNAGHGLPFEQKAAFLKIVREAVLSGLERVGF